MVFLYVFSSFLARWPWPDGFHHVFSHGGPMALARWFCFIMYFDMAARWPWPDGFIMSARWPWPDDFCSCQAGSFDTLIESMFYLHFLFECRKEHG